MPHVNSNLLASDHVEVLLPTSLTQVEPKAKKLDPLLTLHSLKEISNLFEILKIGQELLWWSSG